MKRLCLILLVLPLLLIGTIPLAAGEMDLDFKAPEAKLEFTELGALSRDMTIAIQFNPISLPEYIANQVDFWFEVMKRFARTAKPMVMFKNGTYAGLEITIYEQPKWAVTYGKVYEIEDGELAEQPSFIGVEARDFPMLSDLADIFKKIRPGAMYVNKGFWLYCAYELTEE